MYTIYHKNDPVFDVELNEAYKIKKVSKLYSNKYVPFGLITAPVNDNEKKIINPVNVKKWWENRYFKGKSEKSTYEPYIKNHGISLFDKYWIKDRDDTITWENINPYTNDLDILRGENQITSVYSDIDSYFVEKGVMKIKKEFSPAEMDLMLITSSICGLTYTDSYYENPVMEDEDFVPINNLKYVYENAKYMTPYASLISAGKFYNADISSVLSDLETIEFLADTNISTKDKGFVIDYETKTIKRAAIVYFNNFEYKEHTLFNLKEMGVSDKILSLDRDKMLEKLSSKKDFKGKFEIAYNYSKDIKETIDNPAHNNIERIKNIMREKGMSTTERNVSKVLELKGIMPDTSMSDVINIRMNKTKISRDIDNVDYKEDDVLPTYDDYER